MRSRYLCGKLVEINFMTTTKLKGKKPEEVKPGHLKCVIFAASGIGKTWLSLMFPNPYFCDTEGGASLAHYQKRLKEAGGVYFGPEDGSGDFPTLINEIRILSTEQHSFKTLVIDSISKPYNTIIGKEAERLGDKDGFGASKKPAIAYMRSLINSIDKLDMNVFLICREKTKWSDGKSMEEEEDIWDQLRYELDLTLRLVKQGDKRMAFVKKTRLLGFPEGSSFEANYEEIVSRYGKDYIEASVMPIILASHDQVTEANRLLELLKIDEKEIAKWHTKSKADSFSEYKADDINRLIELLKRKIK